MVGAAELIEALDRRYAQNAPGTKGEQWVTLREARSGAGFDGNDGQCDYLAINTWKSKGLQLIGHEIKVSMSDWKRELDHPEKSDQFARFCRRWWVVMPSQLASKARHDLPPAWGLLSVSEKGRVTEIVTAPSREPLPVPVWWWVGWLAQSDRVEKRRDRSEIDRLVNEAVAQAQERWGGSRPVERMKERYETIEALVGGLKTATGIDLYHTGRWQLDRLAALWKVSQTVDLERLAASLRATADSLERGG